MIVSNRWLATISLLLFSSLLHARGTRGQAAAMPATPCILCFSVDPQTQLFAHGQPVIVVLSVYNSSEQRVFVGRLTGDEFVDSP
jgi:hypothetical protein